MAEKQKPTEVDPLKNYWYQLVKEGILQIKYVSNQIQIRKD